MARRIVNDVEYVKLNAIGTGTFGILNEGNGTIRIVQSDTKPENATTGDFELLPGETVSNLDTTKQYFGISSRCCDTLVLSCNVSEQIPEPTGISFNKNIVSDDEWFLVTVQFNTDVKNFTASSLYLSPVGSSTYRNFTEHNPSMYSCEFKFNVGSDSGTWNIVVDDGYTAIDDTDPVCGKVEKEIVMVNVVAPEPSPGWDWIQ
jgi:hypothetical protein